MKKRQPFQQMVLVQLDIYRLKKKKEPQPKLHILYNLKGGKAEISEAMHFRE